MKLARLLFLVNVLIFSGELFASSEKAEMIQTKRIQLSIERMKRLNSRALYSSQELEAWRAALSDEKTTQQLLRVAQAVDKAEDLSAVQFESIPEISIGKNPILQARKATPQDDFHFTDSRRIVLTKTHAQSKRVTSSTVDMFGLTRTKTVYFSFPTHKQFTLSGSIIVDLTKGSRKSVISFSLDSVYSTFSIINRTFSIGEFDVLTTIMMREFDEKTGVPLEYRSLSPIGVAVTEVDGAGSTSISFQEVLTRVLEQSVLRRPNILMKAAKFPEFAITLKAFETHYGEKFICENFGCDSRSRTGQNMDLYRGIFPILNESIAPHAYKKFIPALLTIYPQIDSSIKGLIELSLKDWNQKIDQRNKLAKLLSEKGLEIADLKYSTGSRVFESVDYGYQNKIALNMLNDNRATVVADVLKISKESLLSRFTHPL